MQSTSKRRQLTEERLLDALEVVLIRDGVRKLSVNAIVDEAGVGKPLLYRYFDNLPGLLAAWAERRGSLQASYGDTGDGREPEDDDEFRQRIAAELVAMATTLRNQPIMLEILAEELTADSELSEILRDVRRRQSRPYLRAMLNDNRYVDPAIRGRIIILNAAIHYLAMRACRAPAFMGLRLDTAAGWNEAMAMVEDIARD